MAEPNRDGRYTTPQRIFFAGVILGGPLPNYFFKLLKTLTYKRHSVFYLNRGATPDQYQSESAISIMKWGELSEKPLKDFLNLFRLINKFRPTCVISCFDAINKLTFLSWLLGVKNRIILHNHTQVMNKVDSKKPRFIYQLYDYWTKLNYKLATAVITVSNGSLRDLKEHFSADKPVTLLTHLMNDPQERQLVNIPEQSGYYITFLGRLEPSKDQFVAIRALRLIYHNFPNLQLKMLGTGSQKEALIHYAEQNGVSDNCQLLGHLDHNTVFSVLKYSSVNLCTSIDEAFGMVNIEALGMGVPVIGTNIGGISDIIKHGYNGYLIDVGDEEQLAYYLTQILQNQELQRQLARQARTDFENNYLITSEKLDEQALAIEELMVHQ